MDEVKKNVLSYNKLSGKIKYSADEVKHAAKSLHEMHADINIRLIKGITYPLGKVFKKIYQGINIRVQDTLNLKKLISENNVVFVPNHQSHADYLIFNYILYKKFNITPYTAGGINLNIFPIGKMFRNMGCVFIRRSFHDDPIYKQTLKSYIHYLMTEKQHPLEFYYEGGRSRNGMLLKPKFGFFGMLIDNYHRSLNNLLPSNGKPLVFIPVSIVHEFLPEQQSLAQEVSGLKKNPESFLQLFGLFNILKKHLGTVHVRVGKPISVPTKIDEPKKMAQNIAFSCFREVANGTPITPVALSSLILLDGPIGGITWENFYIKASEIMTYIKSFNIPLAAQLEKDSWLDELEKSLKFLIDNQMLSEVFQPKLAKKYLVLAESHRVEISYFKNTILHHFFLPGLMFLVWEQIRNKSVTNQSQIEQYTLEKRKELKYDIYLPSVKTMWDLSSRLLSYFTNSKVPSIEQVFALSLEDFENLGERLSIFGNFFRYKYEAYYVGSLTLLNLRDRQFNKDEFFGLTKEIFQLEKLNGYVIKHPESYSLPVMKNTLNYALNQGLVTLDDGLYKIANNSKVKEMSSDIHKIFLISIK
ncbi:MAG: 1-acyl-sn-glycerol-3-phosphate acyltransferase [Oligoflexales bacterium]